MRIILPALLIFVSIACKGQINLYKFGSEPLQSEKKIREKLQTSIESVPNGYTIQPTIKHRIVESDRIINFIDFRGVRSIEKHDPATVDFVFKQDLTYLNMYKKLPDFLLKDFDFQEFSSTVLEGKPVVLFFWSPNIKQCLDQFPVLNNIAKKYDDRVHFVTITHENCDMSFIEDLKVDPLLFKHLVDSGKVFFQELNIEGWPVYFFIDGNGIVRDIQRFMPQVKDDESGKYIFDPTRFEEMIEGLLISKN